MGEPGRALPLPGTSADCAGQAPAGSWARGQGLQTALSPPTAPSSRPRGWLEAPPTFLSSQHTHPPLHFILFAQMRAPWSPLQPQPCLPSCLNMSGAPPLLCPVPPPVLCTLSPPITFKTKAKECLHLSLQDLILSGHPTQLCGLSPHPSLFLVYSAAATASASSAEHTKQAVASGPLLTLYCLGVFPPVCTAQARSSLTSFRTLLQDPRVGKADLTFLDPKAHPKQPPSHLRFSVSIRCFSPPAALSPPGKSYACLLIV